MIPKYSRLSRPDLYHARRAGKSYRASGFSLVILPQKLDHSRFSIITPLSFHKHAVVRNQFRRRTYPILSSVFPAHLDVVFIPSKPMLEWNNEKIYAQLSQFLSKIPLI